MPLHRIWPPHAAPSAFVHILSKSPHLSGSGFTTSHAALPLSLHPVPQFKGQLKHVPPCLMLSPVGRFWKPEPYFSYLISSRAWDWTVAMRGTYILEGRKRNLGLVTVVGRTAGVSRSLVSSCRPPLWCSGQARSLVVTFLPLLIYWLSAVVFFQVCSPVLSVILNFSLIWLFEIRGFISLTGLVAKNRSYSIAVKRKGFICETGWYSCWEGCDSRWCYFLRAHCKWLQILSISQYLSHQYPGPAIPPTVGLYLHLECFLKVQVPTC